MERRLANGEELTPEELERMAQLRKEITDLRNKEKEYLNNKRPQTAEDKARLKELQEAEDA